MAEFRLFVVAARLQILIPGVEESGNLGVEVHSGGVQFLLFFPFLRERDVSLRNDVRQGFIISFSYMAIVAH